MTWTRRRFLLASGAGASVLLLAPTACSSAGDEDGGGATVPEPEAALVTRWAQDPWALGSYSHLAVGATPDHRATLAAPVDDVLFFAGEATSVENPATVHGAVESGRRAADEVVEALDEGARVLVVGAGAAGLAAAGQLAEVGFDVLLLEARDRIGGRIWTAEIEGTPVDLGAAWIHGVDGNPLTELAEQAEVETATTDYEDEVLYGADGEGLDDETFDGAAATAEGALDTARSAAADLDEDTSLGELVEAALEEEGAADDPVVRQQLASIVEHELAADLDELSAWEWDEGVGYDGEDVVFPGGYLPVVEQLAEDVPIRLRTPVQAVAWDETGVTVTVGGDAEEDLDADAVVLTLPIGVLQQDPPAFDPPLPVDKLEAVDALGMGVLDKVVLRFPEVFWDDVTIIGFVNEDAGEWNEWLNLEPATGEPILVGFNAGSVARAIEELDDEEIVASAMAALRTIYEE